MYVIQSGLQPEENSIWNVENLAGLQPILMQDRKVKENMGYNPTYSFFKSGTDQTWSQFQCMLSKAGYSRRRTRVETVNT